MPSCGGQLGNRNGSSSQSNLGDLPTSQPFQTAEVQNCARGWLQNYRSCYAYFDEKVTWSEAEIECQSYGCGAHLASVLNRMEALLLATLISYYQRHPSNIWIGLCDVQQNGSWRWVDGATSNWKAWKANEPNKDNSKYCVELHSSTGFKEWNEAPCEKRNTYVCKYEI